jgi:hypothetical protein
MQPLRFFSKKKLHLPIQLIVDISCVNQTYPAYRYQHSLEMMHAYPQWKWTFSFATVRINKGVAETHGLTCVGFVSSQKHPDL